MFWPTVSDGIRLKAWKTNPMLWRRRIVRRRSLSLVSSVSPSVTAPDVGRSRPAAMWRNVLLPDPDGPMIAVNDPRARPTLTPSSATTAPSPRPWTFRTSRRATTGALTGAPATSRSGVSVLWAWLMICMRPSLDLRHGRSSGADWRVAVGRARVRWCGYPNPPVGGVAHPLPLGGGVSPMGPHEARADNSPRLATTLMIVDDHRSFRDAARRVLER